MDRCHRIGQQRPVLVLRLATAHSVEGKMLARAQSKMALERLVIKKGAFKEVSSSAAAASDADGGASTGLSAGELLELLRGSGGAGDGDTAESGEVDDAMLDKLLERKHLELTSIGPASSVPYPAVGKGYRVVTHEDSSGMLSSINE